MRSSRIGIWVIPIPKQIESEEFVLAHLEKDLAALIASDEGLVAERPYFKESHGNREGGKHRGRAHCHPLSPSPRATYRLGVFEGIAPFGGTASAPYGGPASADAKACGGHTTVARYTRLVKRAGSRRLTQRRLAIGVICLAWAASVKWSRVPRTNNSGAEGV